MLPDEAARDRIERRIIGGFYEVYNYFGDGLPEVVYAAALERELRARGLLVGREVFVPVEYKGEELTRMRMDMVVDECIVVEVKASPLLRERDRRQLYNYIRAARHTHGLLLHFGHAPWFERVRYRGRKQS